MSFICSGKPEYNWRVKINELTPDVFQTWWSHVPSFRAMICKKEYWKDDLDPKTVTQATLPPNIHVYEGILMDAEEVQAWTDIGIEISMSRIKGLTSNARELQQTVFQVSVAGIGLMQIQSVDVLEDCCTDILQKHLDKGWRILAVCPANDTRRPAYVIGHINTKEEAYGYG